MIASLDALAADVVGPNSSDSNYKRFDICGTNRLGMTQMLNLLSESPDTIGQARLVAEVMESSAIRHPIFKIGHDTAPISPRSSLDGIQREPAFSEECLRPSSVHRLQSVG